MFGFVETAKVEIPLWYTFARTFCDEHCNSADSPSALLGQPLSQKTLKVKVVFITLNHKFGIRFLCTLLIFRHRSPWRGQGRFGNSIAVNSLLQFPARITDGLHLYFVQLTFMFSRLIRTKIVLFSVGVLSSPLSSFLFFFCTKLPSGIGNDISVYRRVSVHRDTQLCSLAVT